MTTTTTTTPVVGFGNIIHTEWASTDVNATCTFLTDVFGLNFDAFTDGNGTSMNFGNNDLGLGGAVRELGPNTLAPMACPYISVQNLKETILAAEGAGATTIVPFTPVPGKGFFAWFEAPGGIVLGAWEHNIDAAPIVG